MSRSCASWGAAAVVQKASSMNKQASLFISPPRLAHRQGRHHPVLALNGGQCTYGALFATSGRATV